MNVQEMLDFEKKPAVSIEELSETAMWTNHSTAVWHAKRFKGSPSFYPVYRYRDHYSYSPLSLILLKGDFRLNPEAKKKVSDPGFNYFGGSDTVDLDIVRIGSPPKPEFRIRDAQTYAKKLAQAMCEDVASIETKHPDFTNVLMCGGKDSLNLLLLPWKNPVVVASAPPNYDLVKSFVRDHQLSFDVIKLDDSNDSLIESEVLVNCCRNNLSHCRWGPHLKQISEIYDGKLVFWKGQLGDIITTPYWKKFAYKYLPIKRNLGGRKSRLLRSCLEVTTTTQRLAFNSLWSVCAMWQGAHVSIIRQLTDALVLSGYHGPAVQKVWSQVDLNRAVQEDIRPMIGKVLLGDEVKYPSTNPGPPESEIRKSISHLKPFVEGLRSASIPVYE